MSQSKLAIYGAIGANVAIAVTKFIAAGAMLVSQSAARGERRVQR